MVTTIGEAFKKIKRGGQCDYKKLQKRNRHEVKWSTVGYYQNYTRLNKEKNQKKKIHFLNVVKTSFQSIKKK